MRCFPTLIAIQTASWQANDGHTTLAFPQNAPNHASTHNHYRLRKYIYVRHDLDCTLTVGNAFLVPGMGG